MNGSQVGEKSPEGRPNIQLGQGRNRNRQLPLWHWHFSGEPCLHCHCCRQACLSCSSLDSHHCDPVLTCCAPAGDELMGLMDRGQLCWNRRVVLFAKFCKNVDLRNFIWCTKIFFENKYDQNINRKCNITYMLMIPSSISCLLFIQINTIFIPYFYIL